MTARHSVLIVDSSPENRAVLRTALARRGVEIFEAARADDGLHLLRDRRPDLVVIDADSAESSAEDVSRDYDDALSPRTPLVVLGTWRCDSGHASPATRQFVSKPYHYAPLIRKIEELLAQETRRGVTVCHSR